ncbi:MAG: hypothetical protein Q9205_003105 [Flavoplaca limonia]
MLWQTRLYTGGAFQDDDHSRRKKTPKVLAILKDIAYCLLRDPHETTASANGKESNEATVPNSGSSTKVKCSDWPENARSAPDTETMIDHLYTYCVQRVDLSFQTHAFLVFDLLMNLLNIAILEDVPKDRLVVAQENLVCYVTVASIPELDAALAGPKDLAGRPRIGFHDFLDANNPAQYFSAQERSLSRTDRTCRIYEALASAVNLDISKTDLRAKPSQRIFDREFALFMHQIVAVLFNRILDSLAAISDKKARHKTFTRTFYHNRAKFGKEFKERLEIGQEVQEYRQEESDHDSGDEDTTIDATSSHEKDHSVKEDQRWRKMYKSWLTGITKMARAAVAPKELNYHLHDAKRIQKLQFKCLQPEIPDRSMEDWKESIKRVLLEDQATTLRTTLELISNLQTMANLNKNEVYLYLDNWNFTGTVHCEAAIACSHHAALTSQQPIKRQSQSKIGISKRCCVVCTWVLAELESNQSLNTRAIDFLNSSSRIYQVSLPKNCPIGVARRVQSFLDQYLRLALKHASDEVQKRVDVFNDPYLSKASEDDNKSLHGAPTTLDKLLKDSQTHVEM